MQYSLNTLLFDILDLKLNIEKYNPLLDDKSTQLLKYKDYFFASLFITSENLKGFDFSDTVLDYLFNKSYDTKKEKFKAPKVIKKLKELNFNLKRKSFEVFEKFQKLLSANQALNVDNLEYLFQKRKSVFSTFKKDEILGKPINKKLQITIQKLLEIEDPLAFEYILFLFVLISIFHEDLSTDKNLQYLYNEDDVAKIIPDIKSVTSTTLPIEHSREKLLSSPTIFPKTIYGRDSLIDDVAQQLKENHVVFLYGIGGIGKTQIAKNYIQKYRSEYDTIVYGTYPNTDNSKSNDEPNDGLKELLLSEDVFAFEPKMNRRVLSDGSLENDDDYAGRKLQKIKNLSNERTLIIVDNFDVMNDKLLFEFINGRYHLLITTRCSYENMYPMIKVKEIEDIDDIKQIFFKNYRCDIVTCDDPHLEELIELVNRHTYTIELIAKHMSNSGQSTLEMIDLLKKEGIICLNEEIRNDDCSTEVAFENLKKMFKIFRLSDEEKQILQYMCLMPLDGVKKIDFKKWAGLKSLSKVNNLIDRSWIIQNTNGIALHPIIRDAVRKQLPLTNDNVEFFIINFINDMNDVHNTLRKHHLIYRERKIHLDIAETLIKKITSEKLLYDQLRFIYAYCVFDTGNSNRAVQLFEELLQTSNNLAFKLNCYEKVIQNYVLLGEASIAVEIALKAYEEVKPFAANINSPDIGRHYICLLHRLIEAYRLLGDYEKSLYYGTLCLSQSDKFFEIYKDDLTAWTKYHIGRTLVLKGEPCEEFLKEAMEVFLSNQDDLAVANCNDILALVYKQKGLFVEALTINGEAYKMHTHLLGNFHIDIANNQKWRGDIFLKMKKFDDAEKCYQNAISIYKNKNCRIHVEEVIAILNYIKHMENLEE